MLESGFYNLDCMEAMKGFPDGFFDLAIVDPPYGMNITGQHVVNDGAKIVGGGAALRRLQARAECAERAITRSAVCGSCGRGRPAISRGGGCS